ncbi:MAG: MFS transporter [Actinomycetes bacterium]|jgi:MFS family permease
MTQPRSILSKEILPASLAILSTASLASFESLGVSAALPDIATELGDVGLLPWVVTSYLLTSSLATVIAGPFIDSIGLRLMFRFAVVTFIATSLGITLAPSMGVLVGLRLLQGFAGGLITTIGTSAVSLVYPSHLVSRAFAANATVWGVMAVAGPAIAAVILTFLSWRWIFYIILPLGGMALIAGWKVMPGPYGHRTRGFDGYGIALLTAIVVSTLLAVEALDATSAAWLAAGVIAVVLYVRHARRHPSPVVRLEHLVPQPFRGLAVSPALLLIGTIGMSTYIPLYVRAGLEASPALTAWSVLPHTMGWTLGAITSSRLADRLSESRIVVTGFLVGLPSLALSWLFVVMGAPLLVSCIGYLTAGVGMGMVTNSALTLLRTFAEEAEVGRVVSAHLFARNQGFTFGSAIGGAVLLLVVTGHLGDVNLVRELIASTNAADAPAGAAEAVRSGFAAAVATGAVFGTLGLVSALRMRRFLTPARVALRGEAGRRL